MTAIALSLLLAAAPSFARTHARELFQAGAKAYALGDFVAALADFDKAYEYDAAPALLFNLGQCHHQLRQWEKAVGGHGFPIGSSARRGTPRDLYRLRP